MRLLRYVLRLLGLSFKHKVFLINSLPVGFSYTEIAKLTGYCQRTVRDCLKFNFSATVQGIAALIDVLENESRASKFRS